MSSNRLRRISKELGDLEKDVDNSNIRATTADPNGQDLGNLIGFVQGSPDTPYEGGTYQIEIKIPMDYPFKPPQMRFITKIWHPNVSSQTGAICLDTLGPQWSPVLTIKSTLLSLQSLFESPEPNDPQDAAVATLMKTNPGEHNKRAHEWAITHAQAPRNPRWFNVSAPSAPAPIDPARYKGFSPDLVKEFEEMGFELDAIVVALQRCRASPALPDLSPPMRAAVIESLLGGSG